MLAALNPEALHFLPCLAAVFGPLCRPQEALVGGCGGPQLLAPTTDVAVD